MMRQSRSEMLFFMRMRGIRVRVRVRVSDISKSVSLDNGIIERVDDGVVGRARRDSQAFKFLFFLNFWILVTFYFLFSFFFRWRWRCASGRYLNLDITEKTKHKYGSSEIRKSDWKIEIALLFSLLLYFLLLQFLDIFFSLLFSLGF